MSKEQTINQAFKFHSQGNTSEAAKYYQSFIDQGFKDHRVFSNYGIILKDLGKLKEAEILTRKAIELKPDLAEAYSNLGSILKDIGQLKEAESSLRHAIKLKADLPEAHFNLGNILSRLDNSKEAEYYYRKAIKFKPTFAEAHNNLGNTLKDLGKLKEAEILTRKAIELKPTFAEAYSNLGNIMRDLGKIKEAEILTRKAIELKPDLAESYSSLGNIMRDIGKLKESEILTRKAIELKPTFAEAYSNLGNVMRDLGKIKEAEILTRKAIEVNSDYAEAHSNLGNILDNYGDLKGAELSLRQAIKLKPDLAEAHFNLGNLLSELVNLKEAEYYYRKAIELKVDYAVAYYNLSFILLKAKKFKEGFNKYEWGFKVYNNEKGFRLKLRSSKSEWTPKNKGKVLLWDEQGIGDKILFASLIPEFVEQVDQLIVKVDERLIPLFKRSFNQKIIYINKSQLIDEEKYDSQIAMGSLLKFLRKSKEDFNKGKKNYIKVNESKSTIFKEKLKDLEHEKIIGISWKSTTKHDRGIKLSLEKLLLGIYSPKIKFVCLQYGDVEKEINQLREKHNIRIEIINELDVYNDIDGLASLIAACDEVVSIDNINLHLAGAIGVKTNILLSHKCYWYHGVDDEKSYWYPSVTFFRQENPDEWDTPLKEIKKKIKINS